MGILMDAWTGNECYRRGLRSLACPGSPIMLCTLIRDRQTLGLADSKASGFPLGDHSALSMLHPSGAASGVPALLNVASLQMTLRCPCRFFSSAYPTGQEVSSFAHLSSIFGVFRTTFMYTAYTFFSLLLLLMQRWSIQLLRHDFFHPIMCSRDHFLFGECSHSLTSGQESIVFDLTNPHLMSIQWCCSVAVLNYGANTVNLPFWGIYCTWS
jgi:hypothetical protein